VDYVGRLPRCFESGALQVCQGLQLCAADYPFREYTFECAGLRHMNSPKRIIAVIDDDFRYGGLSKGCWGLPVMAPSHSRQLRNSRQTLSILAIYVQNLSIQCPKIDLIPDFAPSLRRQSSGCGDILWATPAAITLTRCSLERYLIVFSAARCSRLLQESRYWISSTISMRGLACRWNPKGGLFHFIEVLTRTRRSAQSAHDLSIQTA
jgi:hypothetical protein